MFTGSCIFFQNQCNCKTAKCNLFKDVSVYSSSSRSSFLKLSFTALLALISPMAVILNGTSIANKTLKSINAFMYSTLSQSHNSSYNRL